MALKLAPASRPEDAFNRLAFVNLVKCAPCVLSSRPTPTNIRNCVAAEYALCELRDAILPDAVLCLGVEAFEGITGSAALKSRQVLANGHIVRAQLDARLVDFVKVFHPSRSSLRKNWAKTLNAIGTLPPPRDPPEWNTEPLFAHVAHARCYNSLLLRLWRVLYP